MSVGMPRTPYFIGVSGFSSILIFATVTLPAILAAISSRAGAMLLHGPHHSAQKSTRTGPGARNTSASNELSVTLVGFIEFSLTSVAVQPTHNDGEGASEIRGLAKAPSRHPLLEERRADPHQMRTVRPQQRAIHGAILVNR